MTVSTWVGRPPNGYEEANLNNLRRQLAPLDESYTLLANFIVGHREIDLVVLKRNAMFQIEHKFCDAPLTGNVNGPWRLHLATGEARELNGERENPFQQTLFNFAALTKWLEANKPHFLAPGRAESVRFFGRRDDPGPKPMRIHNLLVVSPDLHPASCLELDWRVKVIGAPALFDHLHTQTTPRVDLSPEECTAIARELWLSPWQPEVGEEEREGRGAAEMATLPSLSAAAIVRTRIKALQGAQANDAAVAPPPLRQVLAECWAYLRWSLRSGMVTW